MVNIVEDRRPKMKKFEKFEKFYLKEGLKSLKINWVSGSPCRGNSEA